MVAIVVLVFAIGYIAIAMEHPIKINKAASALLTGVICWALFALMEHSNHEEIQIKLSHNLGEISGILFFLLGAMTIVELIDAHHGFQFISDLIKTSSPKKLLWIVAWLAFFLSALLDNLTTSIVMVSLTRKLIQDKNLKLLFVGMIVIAANAGGAWSPIGDVTTTMLWIGSRVSTVGLIQQLLAPSVVCLLVPLTILTYRIGNSGVIVEKAKHDDIYAGGLAELSPNARLDDGIMELWLFEGKTLGDTVQRAWDLFAGRHMESGQVQKYEISHIQISSESPMYLQMDGEPIRENGECLFEVKERSLKVLVPENVPRTLFKNTPPSS